jgi:hypothetical protein
MQRKWIRPWVAVLAAGVLVVLGAGMARAVDTLFAGTDVSIGLGLATKVGGSQTIAFPALPDKFCGDADFAPGATASSNLAVTYTSSNTAVATIVAGKIHLTGVGTTTISAKQPGNAAWSAAAVVTQDLAVGIGTPVITWANPKAVVYGTALTAIQLNAKASVPGTLAYTPAAGTKLAAGLQSLNVTFTPKDPVRYNSAQKAVDLTVNKSSATITLAGLSQTYNGQPRRVTPTTVPGGLNVDVTYAGAADVPVAAGSYPVVATVNDPNDATGRTKAGTLVVAKGSQTITFPAPSALHYGDADVNLTASASSGLTVNYVSSNPAVATIVNDNQLHVVGAGSVKVTASQAGNGNWKAAPAVAKTLVIGKMSQTLDFPALAGHAMGDADFVPGSSATSGLTVTFASSAPAVATVVAGKIHLVGKGTAVITASQTGNANWSAAPPLKQTLLVAGGAQTITFPALPNKGFGDPDFSPGATASSGLTVSYASSDSKVATIVAGKIHIIGFGTATITATQAGTAGAWFPATEVTRTLTVGMGTPVITWANPAAIPYGTALTATQLNAKANVAGTYAYSPTAATQLPIGTQSLHVTFTPTDAVHYNPAEKSVDLTVTKAAATVTLAGLNQSYTGQPRVVTATTVPAGLNVTISYSGAPDAPVNAGSYPVVATIEDAKATGSKSGTLVVAKAAQTITFAAMPAMRVGDDDYPLTATASSGLAVNYASSAPAVATIVGGKIHVVGSGTATITATQPGDTDHWLAASPAKQTLTVLTELQDIRALYATMKTLIEKHDQAGFLALFAQQYLHQGKFLANQFDIKPGMLDSIKTFTFTITGITVTGLDATVAGTATLAFNDGTTTETWLEPDTTDHSPGIGWLRKTANGWQVMGDQKQAAVGVKTQHDLTAGSDSYSLCLWTDSALAITSVTVSGLGIDPTQLQPDASAQAGLAFSGNAYSGDFTNLSKPPVATAYTFDINFADGSSASYQDTVKSWVAAAPVVTPPAAGSDVIRWTNVSASVPNARYNQVSVSGGGYLWVSAKLPLSQTSIAYNADGTVPGPLVSGEPYTVWVEIINSTRDAAHRRYTFTKP